MVCPEERPLVRPQAHTPAPVGLDAPTPARGQGLQPYGALTLFFRWRKKSVQKKASGTATPGKRLLLPILTAGLAMSRAAELASLRMLSCALGARLFPPSKWAGLFPSAAYRRSAPAQLAWGRLTSCRLKWFLRLGGLAAPSMRVSASVAVGGGQAHSLQGMSGQRVWGREPRGLLPSGGLNRPPNREPCQTGEPWHLSCHGGKPPANWHVSRAPCAPTARSPG